MKPIKIYLLMTMTALFWAGAFVAAKIGISEMTPIQMTFYRFFFASLVITLIMMRKEEKKDWLIKKEDIRFVFVLSLVGMVGYHVLFFKALEYTTAGNASIIAAANPIITMLLASFVLGEVLTLKRIAVFLLAFLGVVLTLTGWNFKEIMALNFNQGELIMVFAVTLWAIYSVLVRKVVKKYSPLILTTYCFVICTIIMFPFAVRDGLIPQISLGAWMGSLYMAIFASVIGYLVQQTAIKEIGPSKANLFVNLVPFFSIILAWMILGETTTLLNILSGCMIVIAVYLNSKIEVIYKESSNEENNKTIV